MQDGAQKLLLTGLRIPITEAGAAGLWDFQSCNGYGGPLATVEADADFLAGAWTAWAAQVAAQGCVAAFFRLHPLLGNEAALPAHATIREDRQTVFISLAQGLEAMWERAEGSHRRQVNKARRQGAVIRWGGRAEWTRFERVYGEAMARLGAPASLRFSGEYFERLQALPGAELASLEQDGRCDGGAVFLLGNRWAHYHLGAREPASGSHVMNSLLQAGTEAAATRGLAGIHLGGGRTAAPDDLLLRFKRNLGGEPRSFRVALVVTDPVKFEELNAAWAVRAGRSPGWLLGYRQPVTLAPQPAQA